MLEQCRFHFWLSLERLSNRIHIELSRELPHNRKIDGLVVSRTLYKMWFRSSEAGKLDLPTGLTLVEPVFMIYKNQISMAREKVKVRVVMVCYGNKRFLSRMRTGPSGLIVP